ncbi:bifunctional 5,10-methylenetetrahydrofolate dehydrogenase/5,10-methenyltetrahydrofolate cyclohydrolase [Guggenheimella bovis]
MIELLGKPYQKEIEKELKEQVEAMQARGITPGLASLLVGNDPASQVYVRNKERMAEKLGIRSFRYTLPEDATEEEVLKTIQEINEHPEIDGLIVELPLPKGIDEKRVIDTISPFKDVDCFTPENVGKLYLGDPVFSPCTPLGAITLLKSYEIPLEGKHCVIIGRSNIVGKPLGAMLLKENATVTIVHSRTQNLPEITKTADILFVAIGKAHFVDETMVKEGAVVVDIGINSLDGKLVGDANFSQLEPIVSAMTPVPGGVGVLTNMMLMKNTIKACELRRVHENRR